MLDRRHVLAAALAACFGPVAAQGGKSPLVADRPVRIVVPMAPGSASDAIARLIAQQLTTILGQPVVVENKPGAATILGSSAVLQAPADGHTLLFTSNGPLLVTPLVNSGAKYTWKSFSPVCGVNRAALVVYTSANAGAPKTFAELVAKIRQGNATFGSPGIGTLSHLVPELMLRKLGLKATHVTYKDSSQSLQDAAQGLTDFAVDAAIAGLAMVTAGKLRPLAVTGNRRLRTMPDVPTLKEAGLAGVDAGALGLLLAPGGLPKPTADYLAAAVDKALKTDEVQARLAAIDFTAAFMTPEQLAAELAAEEGQWSELVRYLAIPKQ